LCLPFVVHGRSSMEDIQYNWVDVNNRSAFYRATEFLMDLGHRRIGFINGLADMDFAMRRYNGYVDALNNRGIELDHQLVQSAEMTETHGYSATMDMMDLNDPPTAFLGASIITSFGIRRAIEERGLQMGRDI